MNDPHYSERFDDAVQEFKSALRATWAYRALHRMVGALNSLILRLTRR